MFVVAAIGVVVAMALALVRAFAGPTLYDRVLAGNSFGTKTVVLIGLMGYLTNRPDFLDIALLYALINFAAVIAILKFFRYRSLAASMDVDDAADDRAVPASRVGDAAPAAPAER
ncbi:MAG: monovalent cation/H+ antiporter complex subunit F [Parvularculaceae bacterium]